MAKTSASGLGALNLYHRAGGADLSRDALKAELLEALRTANPVVNGETGAKFNEVSCPAITPIHAKHKALG